MKRKFFFFDIDGTLQAGRPGNQKVCASTLWTIQELERLGHFCAIATGRSFAMAKDSMEALGFQNMVSDGGNGLILDGKLLGIEPLDHEKCVALIRECEEKNIIWAFNPDDAGRRLAPDTRFRDFTQDVYMKTEVMDHLDPADYPHIYKVYVACYPGQEQALESLKQLPWVRYHKEYLFVEPIDKSAGIRKMVALLHGSAEDVVVFGDERNDLSMFTDDWTGIAMGNAIEELKAKADYVTDDAHQDGIYKACVHFGWIQPNPAFENQETPQLLPVHHPSAA